MHRVAMRCLRAKIRKIISVCMFRGSKKPEFFLSGTSSGGGEVFGAVVWFPRRRVGGRLARRASCRFLGQGRKAVPPGRTGNCFFAYLCASLLLPKEAGGGKGVPSGACTCARQEAEVCCRTGTSVLPRWCSAVPTINALTIVLETMTTQETALDDARERGIYQVTVIGSVVNLVLLTFKFFAGIVGNSAAMMADAVHSLSDFVTDIIVIVFVRISSKPEDKSHDYGHGKYETLATAIIGLFLLAVGVGILWNGATAILDFVRGEELPEPGMLALVAALVSIGSKELLYQYTAFKGRRFNSQAVVANAWHHRSDALSSVGTALGIGGAIVLGKDWRVLDPLAAVVVSVFIIRMSVKLLVPCLEELLEKSLPEEEENRICQAILSFPGVSSPHHLRTRRIGNACAISVHVRMDGRISLEEAHHTATAIENRLKELFGTGTYVSIHVEPDKTPCPQQDGEGRGPEAGKTE